MLHSLTAMFEPRSVITGELNEPQAKNLEKTRNFEPTPLSFLPTSRTKIAINTVLLLLPLLLCEAEANILPFYQSGGKKLKHSHILLMILSSLSTLLKLKT